MTKRFGGTITMGCDPRSRKSRFLADELLYFSHGRAAMIWLIQQMGVFKSAEVCAYTWPDIPRMLRRYGLELGFFDFGQENMDGLIASLPGRCLVIVPVFYGFQPWIDYQALAKKFSGKAFVLLDAAQTAFCFEDYPVPSGGMVLSCPHKATALNDGALLAFGELSEELKRRQQALAPAEEFRRVKEQGRLLLSTGDEQKEQEGLQLVAKLEETWVSDPPQRMTNQSKSELSYLDARAHAYIRRSNYQYLKQRLNQYLPALDQKMGVPFAYAAVTNDRENILKKLYARRVFATALWPNAVFDPGLHPVAADYARRLIALPVDQRYDLQDMDQMADLVMGVL
jgi:hypothetical protein